MYFPLLINEALLIEVVETESKGTIDAFCETFLTIVAEGRWDLGRVKNAPHNTPVGRMNEAEAARALLRGARKAVPT